MRARLGGGRPQHLDESGATTPHGVGLPLRAPVERPARGPYVHGMWTNVRDASPATDDGVDPL